MTSVTDTRPDERSQGGTRNGDCSPRSSAVTDVRPAERPAGPRAVTCRDCGATVGPNVNIFVQSECFTEVTLCIDCLNVLLPRRGMVSRNRGIPWQTWSAIKAGRTWRDYQHWCDYCGRPFLGELARRWCSAACGEAGRAARRDRRRPPLPERRCDDCGELLAGGRSDARYCSSACRQRAYRRRQAAP